MKSQSGNQTKKYLRDKVNEVIQQYQIKKEQQEIEKIKLKQNIMIEIMTNRQKSQSITAKDRSQSNGMENTFKTMLSDNEINELDDFANFNQSKTSKIDSNLSKINAQKGISSNPQSRIEEFHDQTEHSNIEQITFNAKKRNNSLNNELSYQRSKFQYDEPEQTINKQSQNEKINEKSQIQIRRQIKESINNLRIQQYDDGKDEPQDPQIEQKLQNQAQEQEQNRNVFLTMEEDQSKDISEMPRNYAFEIKMDKSEPIENIEELRRAKILDLQRKRQQRLEQFKKGESQKKIEVPKIRNSHSQLKKNKLQNTFEEQEPKYSVIQKKGNKVKKQEKVKHQKQVSKNNSQGLIPLDMHQAQYNVKNESSKNIKNPSANFDSQKHEHRPISPHRTPKSILSQNRGKSVNRTNIFNGQSPNHRDKSANRLKQPQIEPKDRKNSFTKQSNKKLMINAITYVCFPGQLNRKQRQKLIDILESSQHQFFIFLFKQYSRKIIKGIYILDHSQNRLQRIYGDKSPFEITSQKVQEFYRFDSGSREFKKVDGCRSFSLAIHAIDLR